MPIVRYLSIIRRRLLLLLVIPAVLGAVALVYAQSKPSIYESATSLLVRNVAPVTIDPNLATDPTSPTETPLSIELNDLLTNDRIMATYTELATHRVVLQQVISVLSLQYSEAELRSKLHAEHVGNTQLLSISAEDQDPQLAAAIANETARAFVQQSDAEFGEAGTVVIAEEAVPSTAAVSPNVEQAVLLAVVLGIFIAGLVVLLLEHADDRLKTRDDITASAGLPTLAVIGRSRNVSRLRAGESLTLEDYRELRSSVTKLSKELGLRAILVASYGRRNGRTVTALNLSLIMADIGESVILVDADLRQPSLHKLTGAPNDFGLSDLLKRDYTPNEWPLVVVDRGVEVLSSGPPPATQSVISGPTMEALLGELKAAADIVVLDSPALSAVPDALDLARIADGTIIVVESGKTHADDLRLMATLLADRGARVLGVVLNKGRSPRVKQQRYRERRHEGVLPAKRGAITVQPASRREWGLPGHAAVATNGNVGEPASDVTNSLVQEYETAITNGAHTPDAVAPNGGAQLPEFGPVATSPQPAMPVEPESDKPKPRTRRTPARSSVSRGSNGEQPPI